MPEIENVATNQSQKFKVRDIGSIEYEIPDTCEQLTFYYKALWLPELYANFIDKEKRKIQNQLKILSPDARDERLNSLQESVLNTITSDEAIEDGVSRIITEIQENRRNISSKVDIIDLAAGSATAMDELKERVPDLLAVRLDLLVDHLQGQETPAVAGDALQLPFESEITPIVLSRGLILYLLEEPERTHIIPYLTAFLKAKNLFEQQMNFDYIQSRDMYFDLALLDKHFSEMSRVLTTGGTARVEPFYMQYLFGYRDVEHNIKRIQKFMELLETNFSFYQFYDNPFAFHLSQNEIDTAHRLMNKLSDHIPDKDIAKRFNRVFNLKNLTTSVGMLKLKK